MNDILTRLGGYNPPDRTVDDQRQMAVDIQDARAEIERLRSMYRTSDTENDELRARIEQLEAALKEARGAIAHLDPMALGGQHASYPEEQEWYFRDELLSRIDAALANGDVVETTKLKLDTCPSPENPCMCECHHLSIGECWECRMGRHKPKLNTSGAARLAISSLRDDSK